MVINCEKGARQEDSDDIDGNASETDTYTVSYLDPIQLQLQNTSGQSIRQIQKMICMFQPAEIILLEDSRSLKPHIQPLLENVEVQVLPQNYFTNYAKNIKYKKNF